MANKFYQRLILGTGLALASGLASAQSSECSIAVSDYAYYVSLGAGHESYAAEIMANHPACFGGSATNAQVQINATSFAQINAISGAMESRFLGARTPGQMASSGTRGLAAGGAGKAFNVWGNLNNNDTRQSYKNTANQRIKNNSEVLNSVIGVDYALNPTLVVGVSAALDRGDLDSQNVGGGGAKLGSNSKGYVIAPYLGYQLSKEVAFDASIGMGQGKLDSDGGVKAESDRWFGAANLAYNQWFGNLQLTGKLTYMHGEEKYGDIKLNGVSQAGTDSKNTIDQARLGAQAGYWLGGGFMPYAGLVFTRDLHRSTSQFGTDFDPIGKNAWTWTLGVNFFSLASGVTGGIAFNQEEGRDNQKNRNLMANISVRF